MTAHTHNLPRDKETGEPVSPVLKRRVSAKVRKTLEIRIREGKAWKEAACAAGLSEAAIHKARKQPHVLALYDDLKAAYIQEVEDMRAPHKARAFEVARDLLDNSKSDAVKARMVEFLAGEAKGSAVNVAVQVNNHGESGGYEYVRPGAKVVEVVEKDS